MNECDLCEEARGFGALCPTCAAKELGARVVELLDSAHPNPSDHPTMTWAWERARQTLALAGGREAFQTSAAPAWRRWSR